MAIYDRVLSIDTVEAFFDSMAILRFDERICVPRVRDLN